MLVLGLLALDLKVFHRNAHAVTKKEAVVWSVVWIVLALLFNVGIYLLSGSERALEFFTGYLIEKSLSIDNVFVFLMIFSYFAVPAEYQHKVLFWGILGALLLRALFIAVGAVLLQNFHWVVYLFGAFLIITAVKFFIKKDGAPTRLEHNPAIKLLQRLMPVTERYEDAKFFVRRQGQWLATPLLVVLLVVESTDLVFALDSIPAIFAVTGDPFIIYTSNVFAVLGLRTVYFLLAGVIEHFVYLHHGLGAILGFVGIKMVLADVYKIPIGLSLIVISSILGIAIVASLLYPRKKSESKLTVTVRSPKEYPTDHAGR